MEEILLALLELRFHLLDALAGLLLLVLVALTGLEEIFSRFKGFEDLEVDDVAEFEELFLFVLFLLGLDVDGGFFDLVFEPAQLFLKDQLLLFDVNLLLFQLLYAVGEAFVGGGSEEDRGVELLREGEGVSNFDEVLDLRDLERVGNIEVVDFDQFFLLEDFKLAVHLQKFGEDGLDLTVNLVLLFLKVTLLFGVLIDLLIVFADLTD